MSSNTITLDSRFIINIDWSCFLALATSTYKAIDGKLPSAIHFFLHLSFRRRKRIRVSNKEGHWNRHGGGGGGELEYKKDGDAHQEF